MSGEESAVAQAASPPKQDATAKEDAFAPTALRTDSVHGNSDVDGAGSHKGSDDDEHTHTSHRSPWLRAMMMGALDGVLSVASVMLGVGGGSENLQYMRLAGLAAWVAGALSMFLGEYASVAAQRDCEAADIQKEVLMQQQGPEARAHELQELTEIYVNRGLCYDTARKVAEQLTERDVIRAHARDELGIDMDDLSNPLQAGVVDCIAFSAGSAIPLLAGSFIQDHAHRLIAVACAAAFACALFGFLSSVLAGVRIAVGTVRVLVVGLATLGATYGVALGFSKLGV